MRAAACAASLLLLSGGTAPAAASRVDDGARSILRGARAPRAHHNKPNILFLMSDSMDGRVLDPTSPVSSRLELPHLRRLAALGTNFVNTYAASPQCVPSRTTMFAGRHTHNIQAWSNSQALAMRKGKVDAGCAEAYSDAQCQAWGQQQAAAGFHGTFMDSLADAGCVACLYGKVDVGGGVIEVPGQENATVPGFHGGPVLSITGRSADIRKPTKPDPIQITNDMNNHVHPEDWLKTQECMEWFENHDSGGGSPDESWMMYCSVNIPHPKFATNATWLEYVHEDKIDVPTWIPRDQFHPADSYMSQSKDVWRDFSDAEILEVRKTYYAMCAETDYLLGRVLDKANATGHLDNTYVIYVSDHGEMNMEHRQVWKNSMYEASARVPMIVAGPGVPAGRLVSNVTSLLDIYPTMVDMVGGDKPDWLDGHSLAPFLSSAASPAGSNFGTRGGAEGEGEGEGDAYPADRAVVAQYHSNMGNTGSFMVRWGPWKYIAFGRTLKRFADYTPQLFNVATDPEELTDVADTARGKAVAKVLDAKLRAVVDYPEVDKMVIKNDGAIYQRWYLDKLGENATRKKWEGTYQGFDAADWDQVTAWYKEVQEL